MMRWVVIAFIKLYQKTLSFDHGPLKFMYPEGLCKYHPTCSQYAVDSLKERGTAKSIPRIIWRILRCHPWSRGGHDPA